ncbi:MAG: pyruvate kinase [Candidatus Krumholzibacteriota bacterium]|nr:pyruvate kinase [Candidatus Krumholzibacteriota bacterium]
MRRTKIVATIGPACDAPERLAELLAAGVDVARLNFSHEDQAAHGARIRRLREAAAAAGRHLAILQDLAGPKVRVGLLADGPITLQPGRPFIITSRPVPGDATRVSTNTPQLPAAVRPGDHLLLADGALELEVESADAEEIRTRVLVGGRLGAGKGINLPSRSLDVPSLTAKDEADLAFGVAQGVDLVAVSFVRSAADVEAARTLLRAAGGDQPLIAKIEKHEALADLDAIVAAADGVMVARGDLGVETPLASVPRVQKRIIATCNRAGKPVITATQMLLSMVESRRPTRAEVADVANAVLDGSDALMLSEETAVGAQPAEAVAVMARAAADAEIAFPHDHWLQRGEAGGCPPPEATARSACELARELDAAALVAFTYSGSTARLVARCRPRQPVLAMTPRETTCRRLAMVWGVRPALCEDLTDTDAMLARAASAAAEEGLARAGQRLVVIAGLPLGEPGLTNLIKVETLPG